MATSLSHNTSSSYYKNTLEGAESDSVGSSLSSTVGSSSNLLESVHEQELQFSKLAKEIEEEKRLVKQQLDMVHCSFFYFKYNYSLNNSSYTLKNLSFFR